MTSEKILTDERLDDEQLNEVVGGILTMYCFLKGTLPSGQVMYLKDPIKVGPGTDPYSVITKNADFFMDMVTNNLAEFWNPGEPDPFKAFAKENASQWSKPLTYGNTVWSLDVIKGTFTRYTA